MVIGLRSAFHRRLLLSSLGNLGRAVAAFMVIVVALGLPEHFAGERGGVPSGFTPLLRFLLLVLEYVLPPAVLIGALFTVSPLARHHELTALRAAGWSPVRIMAPVLLVGVAATIIAGLLGSVNPAEMDHLASAAATQTVRHARSAHPLTCLLATVFGLALGSTRRERTRFAGFGFAWAILMAFHVVAATAHALGKHGGLPPVVAGWLPTVLFAGLAALLWRRASA